MNVHWQLKKERSGSMSSGEIDQWYEHALSNGAVGGKLIGAGGGGFLMFYSTEKTKLRHAMREVGLTEVRFQFDFQGTQVVIQ
jgi:D-glycero-alpha-D-manno-heptose-7-phosphate kinase